MAEIWVVKIGILCWYRREQGHIFGTHVVADAVTVGSESYPCLYIVEHRGIHIWRVLRAEVRSVGSACVSICEGCSPSRCLYSELSSFVIAARRACVTIVATQDTTLARRRTQLQGLSEPSLMSTRAARL